MQLNFMEFLTRFSYHSRLDISNYKLQSEYLVFGITYTYWIERDRSRERVRREKIAYFVCCLYSVQHQTHCIQQLVFYIFFYLQLSFLHLCFVCILLYTRISLVLLLAGVLIFVLLLNCFMSFVFCYYYKCRSGRANDKKNIILIFSILLFHSILRKFAL